MSWKCLLGDRIYPGIRTLLESLKCWINIMATVILTGAQRGAVYGLGPYNLQAEGLGLRPRIVGDQSPQSRCSGEVLPGARQPTAPRRG